MIEKKEMHCQERNMAVEALVEKKKGRDATPISCTRMMECDRTTFCRFVNPLTTRTPLADTPEEAALPGSA